jgi:hypothetical protein
LVLDCGKDLECLWNTKCEHCRSNTARHNGLQEIAQELNFPELTVDDVKLKIKTNRTRYAAELAEAIRSGKKVVQAYRTFMCQNCFVSN